jgi:hypothetical protein
MFLKRKGGLALLGVFFAIHAFAQAPAPAAKPAAKPAARPKAAAAAATPGKPEKASPNTASPMACASSSSPIRASPP